MGKAVHQSGIPREEIFVTSKFWNSDHGYDSATEGFQTSLDKLGLDYLDLYLVPDPLAAAHARTRAPDLLEPLPGLHAYPILLVVGGVLLGFIPGLPRVTLEPDLMFLIFLPPLLYRDAFTTSWRDFRANIRDISFLAFGLVLLSALLVGVVAHAVVPGLPWAMAFVLGAIVAPSDAVAASVVAHHLTLPPHLLTILEGESLLNDATALVAYILNGLIFILIGLQLPSILDSTSQVSPLTLIGYAAVVSLAVLPVRFAWFIAVAYILRLIYFLRPHGQPWPQWQNATVLGWGGMRGVVSLAAALAVSAATNVGGAFPFRNLVIFLTFSVLVVTLVGQGLTFPSVIRALGITGDGRAEREEAKARFKAAVAGLARLEQLATEEWIDHDQAKAARAQLQDQAQHYRAHYEDTDLETEEE